MGEREESLVNSLSINLKPFYLWLKFELVNVNPHSPPSDNVRAVYAVDAIDDEANVLSADDCSKSRRPFI